MIYIAGDTHGFRVVEFVEKYLISHTFAYENLGVSDPQMAMKLEDMIPTVVKKILKSEYNIGILSCGTGVGVEVGANKFSGIRACLATNEKVAEWSKVYDNCNVLCLVGWETTNEQVDKILDAWFNAEYDGNEERLSMFKTFNTWH